MFPLNVKAINSFISSQTPKFWRSTEAVDDFLRLVKDVFSQKFLRNFLSMKGYGSFTNSKSSSSNWTTLALRKAVPKSRIVAHHWPRAVTQTKIWRVEASAPLLKLSSSRWGTNMHAIVLSFCLHQGQVFW